MDKRYVGTCYIGVVGGETEIGECHDSIAGIGRRMGDTVPQFFRGTKGYEIRQLHIDAFMASSHEFLFLMDHDMVFPTDALERLRSHLLPYVSGYYLRRTYAPIAPVWFEPPSEYFPMQPWLTEPERGKLHEIGASGWGCLLIHRDVIEATRAILKGEQDVIEDDMDIWPYDLRRVMGAIRGLSWLVNDAAAPEKIEDLKGALKPYVDTLASEIRPLRGMNDPIGSDIRYPYLARQAGYVLYGDPDVRCKHTINYHLSPDDYSIQPDGARDQVRQSSVTQVEAERKTIREAIEGMRL